MDKTPSDVQVLEALRAKNVGETPCPACGGQAFGVADVPLRPVVADKEGPVVIPLAVVGCQACGHVSLHAVGPLVQPAKEPPTPNLGLSKEEAETVTRRPWRTPPSRP